MPNNKTQQPAAIRRVLPIDAEPNATAASAAMPAFRMTAVGAWMWFKMGMASRQPAADPARSAAYRTPVRRENRVSATQTTIPPQTNGTATRVKAKTVQAISFSGSAGMYNCPAKQIALVKAKSKARFRSVACGSRLFISSMKMAPAASPNIASDIAMKAKWYHIVTLKMRVRKSSNCRSDSVVRKSPA